MITRRVYSRPNSHDRVVIDFDNEAHSLSVSMTDGAREQTIVLQLNSPQAESDAVTDVTGWLDKNKFFLIDTLNV